MLVQHFILSYLFFIFLTSYTVNCRIFRRSTVEQVLKSENAEDYLKSGGGENEDHDVVKIFTNKSTNDRQLDLHFKAFNKTLSVTLQLHEEEYFITEDTPVWLKTGHHRYVKAHNFSIRNSLKAYSSADGSCFVITDVLKMSENGDIKINGVIGDLVIRSLSSRVHDKLQRSKRSIDERDYYNEYLNDNFISTGFHIVHKRDLSGKNLTHADNITSDEKLSASSKRELSGVPEIIYPRILLVTHCNNGFRSIDDPEIENFILYLLTLWATVDMKFRSFESPKIRLHISGIIIETKYNKSSIIMESLLEEDSELPLVDRGVDIMKIAYKMKLYYKNSVKNPELLPIFTEAPSNVVVAMIGLDLYQAVTDKDRYAPANGVTIETKKCHRLSETGPWSVTIYTVIQHWGFHYEGLLTAAHEMGHVLGANHDNTSCGSTDERYMMYKSGAGLNISQTSHEWSSCSIESIRKTAEKRKGSLCKDFTKKPRGERMYIPLPGQSISLDEQCQSKFSQLQSCDPREQDQTHYERKKRDIVVDNDFYGSDCRLHCRLEKSKASTPRKCRDLGLVLDGSPCRLDYHCINGRCIPIPL